MSNRFSSQNRGGYRNSSQAQKRFVPKRDLHGSDHPQTLSNSLRAAASGGGGGDAEVASTSRVRMGGNGEWVSRASANGNFVVYLPQDEAVAAGLGPEGGSDPVESQQVVDLLNRELSRLLKLRPKDFWREVAIDESLSAFLQSFLKFRSRWYDFPHRGARGIVAGVIVGEFELSRRVFMVLYRLSSNRDPGAKAADSLSQKDHEALLQDKKLLDLPTLLDICAIYGHENEDLSQKLVVNAMKAQPYLRDDFPVLMSQFLSIVHTMYQRCSSSLEVLIGTGGHQDQGSSHLHLDYLEVMDFINDSVVSLESFVSAYKPAAIYLSSPFEMSHGNEELLATLARLHDSLLPSLQRGFRILLGIEDGNKEMMSDLLSNIFISLKMLSARITKLGWRLLYFCYLSDEAFESCPLPASTKMFPANVEDPVVRGDILIQTIRNLAGEQMHCPSGRTWGTFIQSIETNHRVIGRIELLRETGWLSMDGQQWQFLSGIMVNPLQADDKMKSVTSLPESGNKTQTDEDAAIAESKISQIKELFPEYGRGFLLGCLEAYNQDPEEVIQRILEGTLHEELMYLDISLESMPSSKSTSISRHDKGKGKLVEPAISPPAVKAPAMIQNQAGVASGSSSSSVGRFVRKNKDDASDLDTLDTKMEKELAKTAALISQMEYEDEYDDSFDDLGLSVGDAGLDEPEALGDKMYSQRGRGMDGNGGSSTSNADSSKWNSRKKPQFYVKDGKNYSYKVEGSVAVANASEAKLVNQAQKELIHGLGRGGNIPLGAVGRLIESKEDQNEEQSADESVGRGGRGNSRGRGRRGHSSITAKKLPDLKDGQEDGQDGHEVVGRGNSQGGGRRGRGRHNNYRKDRAMSKHMSGLPSHYGT